MTNLIESRLISRLNFRETHLGLFLQPQRLRSGAGASKRSAAGAGPLQRGVRGLSKRILLKERPIAVWLAAIGGEH